MGNKDANDQFWDIEELLPSRPVKKLQKPPSFPDTEAVSIEVNPSSEGKAPNRLEELGMPIPAMQKKEIPSKKILREYSLPHGLIQKITITAWPTEFGFYQKFRKDALRFFEKTNEAAEYVYFFSYMPQYDQMTASQRAYYFYWRSEIRKGIYLKTDINYLFLYIYEILNLPDRILPKEGAVILSRLWAAYREDFAYLDKYLGEWLCDYCLIHKAEPDWITLDVFSGDILGKVSLPEFYLHGKTITWQLMESISAYDYRKSKFYPDHPKEFDFHIPKAAEYMMQTYILPHLSDYGIEPCRISRDSFSGAVACHDIKFKIAVMCTPLRRSFELKQTVTGIIKLCENNLRAVFGIKSRFSPNGVTNEIKAAVSSYFDSIYPERNHKKKKSAADLEEERYLALYEPENKGPADISRALAIEEAAWETAELLHLDEPEEETVIPVMIPEEPVPESMEAPSHEEPIVPVMPMIPEGDFEFLSVLDSFCVRALSAAADGNFDAFCRENGKMAHTVRDTINEITNEQFGDSIIEEDFSLISDYEEELLRILGKA